jgi:hypothetical protein
MDDRRISGRFAIRSGLLFEYEMMRIETYSRQPDLMSHANDFRVGDRF